MTAPTRLGRAFLVGAAHALLATTLGAADAAPPAATPKSTPAPVLIQAAPVQPHLSPLLARNYLEMLQESQRERRGVVLYLNGQSISGIVSKVIGDEAVELRNSTFTRILIRLDRIDAIATN